VAATPVDPSELPQGFKLDPEPQQQDESELPQGFKLDPEPQAKPQQPSWWDQTKKSFSEVIPRAGLDMLLPGLGTLAPSEMLDKPLLDASKLKLEDIPQLVPGALDAIKPGLGSAPVAQNIGRGLVKGAEQFAGGLTTPGNVALIGGTAGLGALGSGVGLLAKVAPILSRLAGAGFSVSMLKSAYDQVPEFKKQVDAGNFEGAAQIAVQILGQTAMGGVGAVHAGTDLVRAEPIENYRARQQAKPPSERDLGAGGTGGVAEPAEVFQGGGLGAPGAETPSPEPPPGFTIDVQPEPEPAVKVSDTLPSPEVANAFAIANAQDYANSLTPTEPAPQQPPMQSAPVEETPNEPAATLEQPARHETAEATRPEAAGHEEEPRVPAEGERPVSQPEPGEPSGEGAGAVDDARQPLLKPEESPQSPNREPEAKPETPEEKNPVPTAEEVRTGAREPVKGEPPTAEAKPPRAEDIRTGEAAPIEGEPKAPAPQAKTGATAIIDAVYQKLKAGESLGNVNDLVKLAEKVTGVSRTSGAWSIKGLYDAMEAGVNKHLLDRGKALMEMDPIEALKELRELMGRITTQGVRTDEQIKNQQFSTPPTEAYVAARVAGITPDDVVLEPSAGNGGLAVWPKSIGAETHVNEIGKGRVANLKELGFEPTAHDGEVINSLLDDKVKPTIVLMNPPFSASTLKSHELKKNNNTFGFNHVHSALQRLAPGGRLVAILGGGQANEPEGGASLSGRKSGNWFTKMQGLGYQLRANVRINGKEYQKYGTNFATRIVVFDKEGSGFEPGAVKSPSTVVRGNFDTLEEAYNALKDVAATRPRPIPAQRGPARPEPVPQQPGAPVPARSGDKGVSGTGESGTGVAGGENVRPSSDPGSLPGSGGTAPGGQLPGRPAQPDRESGDHRPESGSQPATRVESQPEPQGDRSQRAQTEPAQSSESRPLLPDDQREVVADRTAERVALENEKHEHVSDEDDQSAYVTYQPQVKGKAHPGDIVETKTMSTVPLAPITYKPALPADVIAGKGWLSAVQLEAVAIAGQQNDIVLPDGSRASALIGDGTGVGKGSIAAAILWDNYRQGRKRLVWVSEKWDLMDAALGDLHNLGATELLRGITRDENGKFTLGKNAAVTRLDKYGYLDKIAHDGILFTTYSTMRGVDKKGNKRVAQMEQWLRGNDDGDGAYILYDEAHNLKNAVPGPMGKASQIGETAKKLMEKMPKLRSVSLSATAATEVQNLGYLDRLGLWGPGTAFPNGFRQFQSEIGPGGVAAMEMIARELKAQGKYLSRSLAFKGVTYSEKEHKLNDEQKELYRTASKAWASVVDRVEQSIKTTTNGGALQQSRFMSLFYGAQLRFFNVLLTTLKIPSALELANQALADNKSVVITLVNTNEAAQNREKNKDRPAGDEEEGEVQDFDFGPKEMLVDLVKQHYPTQQYVDDVDPNGNPIKRPLYRKDPDGREIPVPNPQAVRERDELIDALNRDLHMPENPLDILVQSLGGPNKVAELTGRKEYYDRSTGKFVPRGDPGIARKEVNLNEMRNFQDGKKRVAILSGAAGTGISLHAGNNVPNKQKRYHITLQVGWSADKAMQMFGRTHRTNQAHPPEYVMLTSDLGGEKRFISTIARRLGSLGALSKGQKNANTGAELMDKVNFETDQGRQATDGFYNALLKDEPVPGTGRTGMEILTAMRVLKPDPLSGALTVPQEDRQNVTRLLNRMLALDPDIQNGAFNYFFDIFEAAVKDAIERGKLDTGVKSLPGDHFEIKEERSLAKDPNTGAETKYYKVEAQERMQRVSPKDLDARLKQYKDSGVQILKSNKSDKLILATNANPIVHADGGVEPAKYVSRPGSGKWEKVPAADIKSATPVEDFAKQEVEKARNEVAATERDLAYWQQHYPGNQHTLHLASKITAQKDALKAAEDLAADPIKWAKERWKEQYEAAPTHISIEHHLIGGAVMRYWNPIKEVAYVRDSIFTTVDSNTRQRVVGVKIPAGAIGKLISRITGGKSTVNASQLHTDVLRNGLTYTLEGNIQVRRGRVGRDQVVQFLPPNPDVAVNLRRMGVLHERGVTPVYYLPTGKEASGVLDAVLKQYPVEGGASNEGERGGATLDFLTGGLLRPNDPNEPEKNYSGLGAFKDKAVRNLSQLEKASEKAHAAAVTTAASRAQAAALIRMAAPRIEAALGDQVTWTDLRRALIESRLRGISARWTDLAQQAKNATDEDLQGALGNWMTSLLQNLHYEPRDPANTAAALASRGDFDRLRDVLADQFDKAAANTAHVMPDAEYDSITRQPNFAKGLKVYKNLMEKAIAENHEANEGVFSDALGPLDTYYPLIPVTDADEIRASSGRLAYRKPRNQANAFATGQADDYTADLDPLSDRIHSAFRANNKAALVQALTDEGLLQKLGRDEEAPETIEYQGRNFKANVVQLNEPRTIITPTKTIHAPATRGVVPEWLDKELQPILDRKNMGSVDPKGLLARITRATLAGPTDAVIHSANLTGTLVANTPFLGESLAGKIAGSLPFTKRAAAMFHILRTDPTTEEAAQEIVEMAKLGLVPEKFASETYSRKFAEQTGAELKRFSFGPTLYGPKGIDIRARLVMYRLAKAINPGMTPKEAYLFVNQLGNYTRALQGVIERNLKETGFSPFYTAGSTMVRNGIHAWTGTGPMPKSGAGWRALQMITTGAIGTIALWALLHKAYRGKWPWEEKDSKLLRIKAKPQDRDSKIGRMLWGNNRSEGSINLTWFSPLVGRGARALGLEGVYDTRMAHGSADQQMEAALAGAINAALSPAVGPPAKMAWLGLTGTEPYVTGLKDDRGRMAPQFFPAVKPQKPGAAGFLKQHVVAPIINLNSLFANVAAATGLSKGIMRDESPSANKWLRMVVDMAAPQLVDRPVRPGARREYLYRQRQGERAAAER
jgi:hypothetical protein